MRQHLRAIRVLTAFGFRAAPWQAALLLVCALVMESSGLVIAVGMKLLADAAVALSLRDGLVAVLVIVLPLGLGVLAAWYFIDLLFTVAERTSALIDKHVMVLTAGIAGLEHHERPDYLDELALLHRQRLGLAFFTNTTVSLLRTAVLLVGSALLLARIHPLLLLLPLFGVGSFLAGRQANVISQRAAEATAERSRLRKHLFGLATSADVGKEVRVFGLSTELLSRHHALTDTIMRDLNRAEWQSAALNAAGALSIASGYVGAITLVLIRAVQGLATPGDVLLAAGLAAQMSGIVFLAVAHGTELLNRLRVARRLLWLTDYAARVRPQSADPAPVPTALTRGIQIQDLSFRYPGTDSEVLKNIALDIPAGSVVALVGENGAGKTTLVKMLCRFYEPDSGQITADGVDLHRFEVGAWRTRLSTGFQDFCRFEFLARETVGVGDLPNLDHIPAMEAALMRAGADDVPEALPAGLETQLGRDWEGGVDLSGGQWQKLALGRAFMREDPLLVILDEPTAAIDAQTEHALFERIATEAHRDERQGTVTLLISHRFSTVRMADHIVVLDKGQIIEQGTHSDLMDNDKLYAELYRLQSRAYQ